MAEARLSGTAAVAVPVHVVRLFDFLFADAPSDPAPAATPSAPRRTRSSETPATDAPVEPTDGNVDGRSSSNPDLNV